MNDLVKVEQDDVELADKSVQKIRDAEAIKAWHALGFVMVDGVKLDALRQLGLHAKQMGILRQQRGVAMFNQQAIMDSMNLLKVLLDFQSATVTTRKGHRSKKDNINRMDLLVKMLCLLSSKLTESQELLLKLEGGTKAIDSGALPDKVNRSFAPGAKISVLANNVQINETQKSPLPAPQSP